MDRSSGITKETWGLDDLDFDGNSRLCFKSLVGLGHHNRVRVDLLLKVSLRALDNQLEFYSV